MASQSNIRAGGAFVELFTRDAALYRGLRQAQQRVAAWGASIQRVGLAAVGLGAGLLAPLLAASKAFAASGDELDKMSARTGVAVESLSALKFAAEQTGTDINMLEKAFFGLSRAVFDFERGSATKGDAFAKLGLSLADLQGLSPEEQFALIADRLNTFEDAATRGAIAQELFGRAGRQLLPLLALGSSGIRQLTDEAERLGIVMTTEQATSAAMFTDAWNRIKRQLQQVVITIGSGLAPAIVELLESAKPVLRTVIDWAKENASLIKTVALVAAGLVAGGSVLIAFAIAVKLVAFTLGALATVLGVIGGVISFLVSPVGLVTAAVVGLTVAFFKMTDTGRGMIAALKRGFASLAGDAMAAFGGIKDAVAAGDLKLAFRILVAFLKIQWREFVSYLMTEWSAAIEGVVVGFESLLVIWERGKIAFRLFVDDMQAAWQSFIGFFTGMADGISSAWTSTTEGVASVWQTEVSAMRAEWEAFSAFFANIGGEIQSDGSTMMNVIKRSQEDLFSILRSGWDSFAGFFTGTTDGIRSAWSSLMDFLGQTTDAFLASDFADTLANAWTGTVDLMESAWNAFFGAFGLSTENIRSAWQSVTASITSLWDSMFTRLAAGWNAFIRFTNAAIDKLPDAIKPEFHLREVVFGGAANEDAPAGGPGGKRQAKPAETPAQKRQRERREQADADLKSARADFQKLLDEAKAAREARNTPFVGPRLPEEELQARAAGVGETTQKSLGTFSATVANRASFDQVDLPKKQLAATEGVKSGIERLVGLVRDNVLVWEG